MKHHPLLLLLLTILLTAQPSEAHRSGCHRWHSCPSDSGSYTCGDNGYCSGCPDNIYCSGGSPITKTTSKEVIFTESVQAPTVTAPQTPVITSPTGNVLVSVIPPLNDSKPINKLKRVVVIANSVDWGNSIDFRVQLNNEGFEVVKVSASSISNVKNESILIILGGPDAPEGVGQIVSNILYDSEKNLLRSGLGNHKMYIKTDVWTKSQRIIIIAGSTRDDTKKSSIENNYLFLK